MKMSQILRKLKCINQHFLICKPEYTPNHKPPDIILSKIIVLST